MDRVAKNNVQASAALTSVLEFYPLLVDVIVHAPTPYASASSPKVLSLTSVGLGFLLLLCALVQ